MSEVESSRTHFEVLGLEGQAFGLGLEAPSPRKLPVLGSRTALFFELLKNFVDRLKKNFEDLFLEIAGKIKKKFFLRLFFGEHLPLVSFVLGLGLEHSCPCPRKGCPLAHSVGFFCVLGLGLEPCVLDSTSDIRITMTKRQKGGIVCSTKLK